MKHFLLITLITCIGIACNDEAVAPPYPAKYEYSDAEYPNQYFYFAVDQDTVINAFNPIGSSMEEVNNTLINSDLDTLIEGVDESMSQFFSLELISDTELILSVWEDGVKEDISTTYQINNSEIIIDGFVHDSEDFRILYNQSSDRFELVFSLEVFSNYWEATGESFNSANVQHIGDVAFGDTDEILSRYPLGPRDSIGIGFGHVVWERI